MTADAAISRYCAYGSMLVSDTPMPELIAAPEDAGLPEIRLLLRTAHRRHVEPLRWTLSWKLPDGAPWMLYAPIPGGYMIRFPELADFSVTNDACEVAAFRCGPLISDTTVRHLLLDQVMPLVFKLKGREPLHATSVLTPMGVCAFIGPTGAGKSTLAASFLTVGYPTMTDDCMLLDERDGAIYATPAYPGVRLFDDSYGALAGESKDLTPVAQYTTKMRWLPNQRDRTFPASPKKLSRIYRVLRADGEGDNPGSTRGAPYIERLGPREGFMELASATFRMDATDRAGLKREFAFLSRVAEVVAMRRLWVPNQLSALGTIREAVLADLVHAWG